MTTSTLTRVAIVAATALTLSACGGAGAPADPEISTDCTAADFDQSGAPLRADCRLVLISAEFIDGADEYLVVSETQSDAAAELEALGLIPDVYADVDAAFEDFTESMEMANDAQRIDQMLNRTLYARDSGDEMGVVGDYLSAEDLHASADRDGNIFSGVERSISGPSTFSVQVDYSTDEWTLDVTENIPSAGRLTLEFPGAVSETNGVAHGNFVTWIWDGEEPVVLQATYTT